LHFKMQVFRENDCILPINYNKLLYLQYYDKIISYNIIYAYRPGVDQLPSTKGTICPQYNIPVADTLTYFIFRFIIPTRKMEEVNR